MIDNETNYFFIDWQVDDIQTTNAATLRAKKVLESELESLQQQLESALKSKSEVNVVFCVCIWYDGRVM